MIIRVVKMEFRKEAVEVFRQLFDQRKEQIRGFKGCLHLELLQDSKQKNIIWTYSHWQSESALERYRHSDLFRDTWTRTKSLFSQKAQAWSLERIDILAGIPDLGRSQDS